MENRRQEVVTEERDLGVVVSNDLKASKQCRTAYTKAMRTLEMMKEQLYIKRKTLLKLYKTLIRPLLEYCSSTWSPHYVKDKQPLEKAQHWFTRTVPGLARMEYQDQLKVLNIWSLEERRNRADLLETFKVVKGLSTMPANSFFEISKDKRTRGHDWKLVKHHCRTDVRKFFFSERVINRWNQLDQVSIEAKTLNAFKSQLERITRTRKEFYLDR